jgi:phosphoserine phosphatase
MTQNLKPLVLTLVAINKANYQKCNIFISNIFNDRNITSIKFKKLSKFAKDFYFSCNIQDYLIIKKNLTKISNKADIVVQETQFRKKKLIACDMDMTIINLETIDLISDNLLENNKIKNITKKAMNGDINFKDSIIARTKLLKGIYKKDIKKLATNIKINNGVKSVIRTMNNFGHHTMLISGGYDIIVNDIGKKIGFKEILSNSLEISNNILTGNLNKKILDKKGKLLKFKKRMDMLKIHKEMTLAIGDGDNDIDMIKFAGLGVAWNSYPKVRKAADVSIGLKFKSLLYFQGYSDKEIVY